MSRSGRLGRAVGIVNGMQAGALFEPDEGHEGAQDLRLAPDPMFDDLLTLVAPTEGRRKGLRGEQQESLSEGAVMAAYALHLLRTTDARYVAIHPDGEHGKRFLFRPWLEKQGFKQTRALGTTPYGGIYHNADGAQIELFPKSGQGDVVARIGDRLLIAEAKGGIINTSHPGVTSRLRRGLCEAVGLLLATPLEEGMRQVAVVPHVDVTRRLAERMVPRLRLAGIEIALVDGRGNVTDVR